ncbi:MAG: glutaminase A [Myxococcota bacterium]
MAGDAVDYERNLSEAVEAARRNTSGAPASYIPELAEADLEQVSAAITHCDGTVVHAGDPGHELTFQSSAKLLVLTGLLEEQGPDAVFSSVGKEPSGGSFASVALLETHGPRPRNPLMNSGAIALCDRVRGNLEDRIAWIERWSETLYGEPLTINQRVMLSERRTGDRNRSIAYLLRAGGIVTQNVSETLEMYFALCAVQGTVGHASRFAALLARGGRLPGGRDQVISRETAATVVALMATCGMYDESGTHLVRTGLPAKSGVSGIIVAVVPGRAGIAVASPRLNEKGGSCRGHQVLADLSHRLGWHFALPRSY